MNNIFGLLGKKLSHSKSPEIHFAILNELKIKGGYYIFEVDEINLKKAFEAFKVLKVKGINVTIPYKIKVMEFLDDLSYEARLIGSVNTIKFKDGYAIGYNTDYYGFKYSLERYGIEGKNKTVCVLGSGGAARSVIQVFKDLNAREIVVVTRQKNGKVIDGVKVIDYEDVSSFKGADILVNCTPLGMYPDVNFSPLDKKDIIKFEKVFDLIYNPSETLLMKYAKEFNIPCYNGFYMLLLQAIKSQEIWNEIYISDEFVDRIIKNVNIYV
ncbi:shikimate dehydrogenase [Caloramator fervidus]|uniref:Shikimate dehydrogenase (NADP(+)) n=1 Tax=Caloramator fervidus TaxID=29344 RepID=A0A1H5V2K9_9CLOT|nr:shikimate dehydrogenase [Caloramator fervidus]SEF81513.1 shikimate dehydrogenase [Caloramator fervidus]